MITPDVFARAAAVLDLARAVGVRIATAESCTGGLVAAALTDIPGASDAFDRGWVSYSNAAKSALLGVDPGLIDAHGAVSENVARAMAQGALERSEAGLSVSITGVAGPGGGTAAKPVGLVWFATARRSGETHAFEQRFGDLGRAGVRGAAVIAALDALSARLQLREG